MKKLSLTVIGWYLSILAAFSQTGSDSAYKNKKLSLEEINFVSGYYRQDGGHSAVTGGIGTEKLTDLANTIELKLSRYRGPGIKQTFNVEFGVDHYTSASSDKIDPVSISSASYRDTRIYPSLGWSVQNEQKKTTFGATVSFSTEYDYLSKGIGLNFSKGSKDNSREFSARLQAYFDRWSVIYPIELRPGGEEKAGHAPRNSYSVALSLSQIINKKLQLIWLAEPTFQKGLLATKYQRVYFSDGPVRMEELPGTRLKIPLGIRANYFLGDKFVLRSFYRFYRDDWGLQAHTAEIEAPVKLSPFFSLSPFYRFYWQQGVDYFAVYNTHHSSERYYTSDYDLSGFTSNFFGANLRLVPSSGVFGLTRFRSIELRYGHYLRSDGLASDQFTMHLQFK